MLSYLIVFISGITDINFISSNRWPLAQILMMYCVLRILCIWLLVLDAKWVESIIVYSVGIKTAFALQKLVKYSILSKK